MPTCLELGLDSPQCLQKVVNKNKPKKRYTLMTFLWQNHDISEMTLMGQNYDFVRVITQELFLTFIPQIHFGTYQSKVIILSWKCHRGYNTQFCHEFVMTHLNDKVITLSQKCHGGEEA